MNFRLYTKFIPSGDQPLAIETLSAGLERGLKFQTLIGATGTGKTFTMANIIQNISKPALILSHNKTLAAQLFAEFKEFFPENAVEYFVSYYDYYQPEAYVPSKDLYIEKDSDINETIERYRNSATMSLLSRRDVLIISTVSCIYGLGNPDDYNALSFNLVVGESVHREKFLARLRDMQYERIDSGFEFGSYKVRGDTVYINLPVQDDLALRIDFFDSIIESLKIVNAISGELIKSVSEFIIFPAKHNVSPEDKLKSVLPRIYEDMQKEVQEFEQKGKVVESARLKQRVLYDLEMIEETGYTKGIENYSRYIDGRDVGTPPSTLLDYFPDDYIIFIDESHITVPQIGGMHSGDLARKQNLVNFGFRMKSALDNRPLKFEEFMKRVNQVVFVSATPRAWEINLSKSMIFKH